MRPPVLLSAATLLVSLGACGRDAPPPPPSAASRSDVPTTARPTPLIIAHRGASGHLPEHTLEAYSLAIDMGADYVEPDLVPTKDGVLVARHENEIGGTTDVADRFPERRRSSVIDGTSVTGWFTEDFTLAELRTLRARERLDTRSHANDGRFAVPTFDEVLALVRRRERETGRVIGVYPETKHPSHFAELGLPLEPPLLATLARHGYGARDDAVFIQSFEVANLRALRAGGAPFRLAQLVDADGAPADFVRRGDPRRYRDLLTPDGLREIASYADAVAPHKGHVLPVNLLGFLGEPTTLVRDAHAAGLEVHVWTLRSDSPFLPAGWKGDALAEWRRFAELGVDGIFGDFADDGVRALRTAPR